MWLAATTYWPWPVLDPGGNLPSMRFSTENYFTGGYHPMGMVGLGGTPLKTELMGLAFDDPQKDRTLHYLLPGGAAERKMREKKMAE